MRNVLVKEPINEVLPLECHWLLAIVLLFLVSSGCFQCNLQVHKVPQLHAEAHSTKDIGQHLKFLHLLFNFYIHTTKLRESDMLTSTYSRKQSKKQTRLTYIKNCLIFLRKVQTPPILAKWLNNSPGQSNSTCWYWWQHQETRWQTKVIAHTLHISHWLDIK